MAEVAGSIGNLRHPTQPARRSVFRTGHPGERVVHFPDGPRLQQQVRAQTPEALCITGVDVGRIDPVNTLKSASYPVPLTLSRALTYFEERALESGPFEGELAAGRLWITSSLEAILNEGGAEEVAAALKDASTKGERDRRAAINEKRRLGELATDIENKFLIVFHDQE